MSTLWSPPFLALVLVMSLSMVSLFAMPGSGGGSGVESRQVTRDGTIFVNVSYQAGFRDVNANFLAWGDYDNDGDEDILISGDRLFRNNGAPDWDFTDVTAAVGLSNVGSYGVWGDYNNDGWLDIFSCAGKGHQDVLWQNNGGGFTDVSDTAGIPMNTDPHTAAGWADYDNDGFLDIYITGGEDWNDGDPIYYGDILLHNEGGTAFTNVTAQAGVDTFSDPSYGRGVEWCDFNEDGYQDIYISNYRLRANYLWENQGNGTFVDSAAEKGVQGESSSRLGNDYYGHTVGSAWADFNNDLNFDIWETCLAHKDLYRGPICGNSELLISNGKSSGYTFTDKRDGSGIPIKPVMGGEDELMVGIAVGDYDNDGYEDMFIPQIYDDVSYAYSYMYHNDGSLHFTETSDLCGIKVWNTYAGCWCDYDNDGDLDLITGGKIVPDTGAKKEIRFYRNTGNDNHWLKLRLTGTESNSAAIGARAVVHYGPDKALVQMRQVEGGMGCHAHQNSLELEFGLGGNGGPVDVDIHWPLGRVERYVNVTVDRQMNITESTASSDVVVTSFEPDNLHPVTGDDITCGIGISVNGTQYVSSMDVDVGCRELDTGAETILNSKHFDMIEAGGLLDVTMSVTAPSAGSYTFYASVTDVLPADPDAANDRLERTLMVREENIRPVASLTVDPEDVAVFGDIVFDATGSYDDVAVVAYRFVLGDGEDTGWTNDSVVHHSYSMHGLYNASLCVRDSDGVISEHVYREILVSSTGGGGGGGGGGGNTSAPVVEILSLYPSPAYEGDEVTMVGKVVSSSADIKEYRWKIQGGSTIGHGMECIYTFLVDGTYEIEFTVMDTNGLRSVSAVRTLEVKDRPNTISLAITGPSRGYNAADSFVITGTASDDHYDISHVEISLDGGNWMGVNGKTDWSFFVDIGMLENGNHSVKVRAFNSIGEVSMTRELTFHVERPDAPDNTGSGDMMNMTVWAFLGFFVIVALFAAVMLVILSRRR